MHLQETRINQLVLRVNINPSIMMEALKRDKSAEVVDSSAEAEEEAEVNEYTYHHLKISINTLIKYITSNIQTIIILH